MRNQSEPAQVGDGRRRRDVGGLDSESALPGRPRGRRQGFGGFDLHFSLNLLESLDRTFHKINALPHLMLLHCIAISDDFLSARPFRICASHGINYTDNLGPFSERLERANLPPNFTTTATAIPSLVTSCVNLTLPRLADATIAGQIIRPCRREQFE